MARVYPLSPDALLDYLFPWGDWLEVDADETITSHAITTSSGITVTTHTATADGTGVIVWVRATSSSVPEDQQVICHIETSAGRKDSRVLNLRVRQR